MGEVENAPEIPVVAFSAIVTDRADAPAGLPISSLHGAEEAARFL